VVELERCRQSTFNSSQNAGKFAPCPTVILEAHFLSHIKYMQYPIIKTYYDRLKKDSLEADVDAMWNNILHLYFTIQKNYGVEQESRPLKAISKRTDFTVRYVKKGVSKKIIIIEVQRVAYEAQSSVWAEAVEQLTDYMTLVRTEQKDDIALYAIVTVGHYSRFYLFTPGENHLTDYPGTNGKFFEFKNDEAQIERLLNELVTKTSS